MHVLDPALDAIRHEFDVAETRAAHHARTDIVRNLQQFVRLVQQYQSQQNWTDAVLDGANHFVSQAALFLIQNGVAILAGQRNLILESDHSFAIDNTPAFLSVVTTKDPLTAMRTERELSAVLSTAITSSRVHLLPVLNDDRVVAVLLAATDVSLDLSALELISSIASMALQRRSNTQLHTQIAAAGLAPSNIQKQSSPEPHGAPVPWSRLSEQERTLHLRAQRFARTRVAEMQLSKPEAARAGRAQSNYYLFLKPEIDAARQQFRNQFMTTPSMLDYLHLELVRVALEGDESKLGADYPGHLE